MAASDVSLGFQELLALPGTAQDLCPGGQLARPVLSGAGLSQNVRTTTESLDAVLANCERDTAITARISGTVRRTGFNRCRIW